MKKVVYHKSGIVSHTFEKAWEHSCDKQVDVYFEFNGKLVTIIDIKDNNRDVEELE